MSRACNVLALVLALATAPLADAAVTWTRVHTGITQPVDITGARDGSGRLFLVQQTGQVRVVRNGALLATPFLNIGTLVTASGEQGLLGLAFHPQYATNRQFYVNYTRAGDGATVIARYTAPTAASDTADPASAQVLLVIPQPYTNHNGGALKFGPDGFLYIPLGDGGSGNDPQARAQDRTTLLGKVLRIDVNGGNPYAIPPGNPWANGVGGLPEIFAVGVRNPWRASFDRVTGDFWLGDVGQGAQEEIDLLPAGTGAGANLGWRVVEGTQCTGLSGPVSCSDPTLVAPVITYTHSLGCSVTGGFVYRGTQVPSLANSYVYGDFCSGRLWAAQRNASNQWVPAQLADTAFGISTFGEDDAGELYFADYGTGDIYRFAETAPPATPLLGLSATSVAFGSVAVGASAAQTITVSNGGGGTLTLTSLSVSGGIFNPEFTRSGTCANGTGLAAAQTCTIIVTFRPASAGAKSGTLTVASNGGSAAIPLTGTGSTGSAAPLLRTSVGALAFGSVTLGSSSATQTVTVSNGGSGTLTLGSLTAGGTHPGDFARTGSCAVGTNLTGTQSCTIVYQFTPAAAGARSASLAIASNGGSATLALTGTGSAGTAVPVLTASPTSLSFGIFGGAAPKTVTVINTGSGVLTLGTFTLSGVHAGDFARSGTCTGGLGLAAAQSCTMVVTFVAQGPGARSATLTVTSNGGTAAIALSGRGGR